MNNIIRLLEESAKNNPDKYVFVEKDNQISYSEFIDKSKCFGNYFINEGFCKDSIAIFMPKGIECLIAMFGTLYSACYYSVLDVESPKERLNAIFSSLNPKVIVTDSDNYEKLRTDCEGTFKIALIEDIIKNIFDDELVYDSVNKSIDADPAYVLYTSGSTGVPKGTVVSHNSVISYIDSIITTFKFDESVIFGSQTPLYFSMSILDVFTTIAVGGTYVVIPKSFFSFPVKLIEYLNDKQVNSIYWVPTALSFVAKVKTFKVVKPEYLKRVLFAGEVMPVKFLNYWMDNLQNCLFANLYGPTEITDTGTYYIVDRRYEDNESLPIGRPFVNCDCIVLNDKNELAKINEEGEICFRGAFLASGYIDMPEKTKEVFCQNPLNKRFPEKIYRTGDLGYINEEGLLIYVSRKDFQIKKMGYRIELGEIESNMSAIDGVEDCVCIYVSNKQKLILFYSGELPEEGVINESKHKLIKYMQPDEIVKLRAIPINPNGKYDRKKLIDLYQKE
ncbi:amino acid adenylation domain-containing protein [Butyrivibrio sp. LB2008]|uniref:amino acid adenylation domain-containing protein n=1 Tax=Butyrivibrio sp. LB2008 TaxID=1408305 RepID=UPI00047CE123|nr:amino acid adenylation domain-containing protein [Butyrivibrio sp. LB2008]